MFFVLQPAKSLSFLRIGCIDFFDYFRTILLYHIYIMKHYFLIFAFLLLTHLGFSQQQGNIVEYFGKERIEKTEEGTVKHYFTEGLFLPRASKGGGVYLSQDIIAWQYATGKFTKPQSALAVSAFFPNDSLPSWKSIAADTTHTFRNRQLRNATLYTSYLSPASEVVLLDAKGHTRVYINGLPYEGDHYDFGYTLIPVKLKKGNNDFVYTPGRFGQVNSKLITPKKSTFFTLRDMTLPDLIVGETDEKWAAVRVVNCSEKSLKNLTITAQLPTGEKVSTTGGNIIPLAVRKLGFKLPATKEKEEKPIKVKLTLQAGNQIIDTTTITVQLRPTSTYHERTFISNVDGSVQYYSVTPSTTQQTGQALFLSVHGASVEARNQARAYKSKDWGTLVAATNRRPFGFNWEAWGAVDALEVLQTAKNLFKPDLQKVYLTGHSMGGHGTWYLGATYPDLFAAIAPCASYPDILGYGRARPTENIANQPFYSLFQRAANGGRTLSLKNNYLQSGVYILHGDKDDVVPLSQAQQMRKELGEFHTDFCYYEYPGGTHWYGDHSVDWFPIFEYFKWHKIPEIKDVKKLNFTTATPAISATNYWVKIEQQTESYQFSNVDFTVKGDTISGKLSNVNTLELQIDKLGLTNPTVILNGQTVAGVTNKPTIFTMTNGQWNIAQELDVKQKTAVRSGGFKHAFMNNVVFVYATGGTAKENEWYLNKARFDAETFLYRGNGSIETVSDKDFLSGNFKGRNIVLYGNASNNKAWKTVIPHAPIQVLKGELKFGNQTIKSSDIGVYFIYPHVSDPTVSVGVIAGTGEEGMYATWHNHYFSGITGFPDYTIFSAETLKDGLTGCKFVGFFNQKWEIE